MNSRTLIVILTVVNLVLAVVVWTNSLWAKSDSVESQQILTVLRARAIELVDERGQVRSRLVVESSGEVVFRLLDQRGMIRVKLGAGEDGSGLVLLDEGTEPGIHLIARQIGTIEKPTTTSIPRGWPSAAMSRVTMRAVPTNTFMTTSGYTLRRHRL